MKKLLLITLALLFVNSFQAMSQNLEIGGSVGYMMSGQVYLIKGDADITNNVVYGGFTHLKVSKGIFLELLYLRKDTEAQYTDFFRNIREYYDMSVEYYHIGGVQTFGSNDKIKPFASFSLGTTRFHLDDGGASYGDEWKFSIAPSIGAKIYLTEKLGIQTQARLLMPLTFDGYGIFWSSSSGTSGGFSFEVPVWQGDFSGGLFIRL